MTDLVFEGGATVAQWRSVERKGRHTRRHLYHFLWISSHFGGEHFRRCLLTFLVLSSSVSLVKLVASVTIKYASLLDVLSLHVITYVKRTNKPHTTHTANVTVLFPQHGNVKLCYTRQNYTI